MKTPTRGLSDSTRTSRSASGLATTTSGSRLGRTSRVRKRRCRCGWSSCRATSTAATTRTTRPTSRRRATSSFSPSIRRPVRSSRPRQQARSTKRSSPEPSPAGSAGKRSPVTIRLPSVPIDLRSDTVTLPTAGMRAAMAAAPVGDDQFGEDPTVNALQDRVAEMLGKQAALWLPSGTMANQVALRALTRPGDDVIVSRECHAVWHETGGGAANAGVQFTEIGSGGVFTADEFIHAYKPAGHLLYPPSALVQIENTHNRAGGVVVPQDIVDAVCTAARARGVATFLDGARIWNAAIASHRSIAELAAPFDVVTVAFSKGLGAPAGLPL